MWHTLRMKPAMINTVNSYSTTGILLVFTLDSISYGISRLQYAEWRFRHRSCHSAPPNTASRLDGLSHKIANDYRHFADAVEQHTTIEHVTVIVIRKARDLPKRTFFKSFQPEELASKTLVVCKPIQYFRDINQTCTHCKTYMST